MKKLLSLCFLLSGLVLTAQIGGRSAFQFLNVVPSARVAGQGGNAIANTSDDLNFALWNPSLLNQGMHNQVSISMVDYLSDIVLGDVAYARHFDSLGTFMINLRYFNYGDFDRANNIGVRTGTFTATDVAFSMGYAYELDTNWRFGANLKYIQSNYEAYRSDGVALDMAATYQIPSRRTAIALVVKNLGFQFSPYNEERENPPFEIQLGFSNRFEHLPLRWQITLEQLETFDLRYKDPNDRVFNQLTSQVEETPPNMVNNILRHVVVGAEFAPTKGLDIQFGYNFRKRQELNLDSRRTSAGFSVGIGIKISKFKINYARNMYHVAGSANHFSIITDLGGFKKS